MSEYWNEVGQNLSKWPQALGKVAVAATAGATAGAGVGAVFGGVGAVPGALIGGVAAGATSATAQILDTFVKEPTDTSDFAKGLYFDQVEADANKLADTEKALGETQVERDELQNGLDKAIKRLDKAIKRIGELIAENEKLKGLSETTVLILAGYITGQIEDESRVVPDTKTKKEERTKEEIETFQKSKEYTDNKSKYEIVRSVDGKTGKVFILGLEGRLKAIGIDTQKVTLLIAEIKEVQKTIREEIIEAEATKQAEAAKQAEEVAKPPEPKPPTEQAEEIAKPPEAKLPTESAQPSTEEAKLRKQAESAKNPEPPG